MVTLGTQIDSVFSLHQDSPSTLSRLQFQDLPLGLNLSLLPVLPEELEEECRYFFLKWRSSAEYLRGERVGGEAGEKGPSGSGGCGEGVRGGPASSTGGDSPCGGSPGSP